MSNLLYIIIFLAVDERRRKILMYVSPKDKKNIMRVATAIASTPVDRRQIKPKPG